MKYEAQNKLKKARAKMVAYAQKHPDLSFREIGERFGVTGAAVSLACREAGYRRQEPRKGREA